MRTFTEWMDLRSVQGPIADWIYTSEGSVEDAEKFIETKAKELFRDIEVGEAVQSQDGKVIIPLKGEPMVTLFELEVIGITNV